MQTINKEVIINRKNKLFWVENILLVAILATFAFFYVLTTRNVNLNKLQDIENLVSKHYVLSKNETPALVTVIDKSKLSTPFLKQAENGDKILIYQNAKKVIIYRPSIDRIVDVGPVSVVPLNKGNSKSQ